MSFGSPGPYPTPSETIITSGGASVGGPIYMKFRQFVPSYDDVVDEHIYEDEGASYLIRTDTAPIIFLFEYPGNIDEDDAAILDNHRADAFGKAFGFELTNPRTGEVFQNVHYLDGQDDHDKVWMQKRVIRLIWRPA